MAKFKNIETGEVVEAQLLEEPQGVVDEDHPNYDPEKGRQVEFEAGIFVVVHEDGTITTCHPSQFEEQFEKAGKK